MNSNKKTRDFLDAIGCCLKKAIAEDLWRHKRLGHSIIVSRDGEVVEVPPEEIVVQTEYLDVDPKYF